MTPRKWKVLFVNLWLFVIITWWLLFPYSIKNNNDLDFVFVDDTESHNKGELIRYTADKDMEWLFPLPPNVPLDQQWRYKSKDLYWSKNDSIFRKFQDHKIKLESSIPTSLNEEVHRVCTILNKKGREKLCKMFTQCYLNTMETTVALLHDGTTYIITGDIPLMWMRDSSAQVHHYLPLLQKDPLIQSLVEGNDSFFSN